LLVLLVLAILGIGPWAKYMSWITTSEKWIIDHTAHPILAAFFLGLIFSTWLIPDAWKWWKKHFPKNSRAELSVIGPDLF
jgi:hypothetical protein